MSSEQIKVGSSDLEQADHLRRIFEAIPEGVICADREERRIILVNPVAEKMFGYREKELIGLRIDCLYSSREDCEQVGREWLSSEWEPSAKPFETTLKKKDGSIFPAEIQAIPVKGGSGEIICFLKLIRDISERKQLEDSLRSMEVKFRTVADFTYDWECWLQPNGRFRYVSPSCRRLTGRPVEEFMDNPSLFRDIIHPEDKPVWDAHYRDARARAGLREVQFRIVRTDGEVRWIEHACQPVIDEYGTLQGFRSSNRDITRRKEYENELSQALAEIESYKDQLQAETEYLRQEMNVRLNYDSIVGSSNALQYIFFKIEQISTSDTTVLLFGETGTGKELFARAIHKSSARKNHPLIKVNCATLPANLIESELFGHEKGAFTSADRRHIGRFELADRGTIFLDEIGELPLELQPKLLRVLQEGEFERLGASRTTRVDVRVIAATNRDLKMDMERGLFRKDLWYRLNVFPITAPPLRDRVEDISQLALYFMEIFCRRLGKNISTIPAEVISCLEQYAWPGNVRELENVLERAVINTSGTSLVLADELKKPSIATEADFPTLEEVQRNYILKALEKSSWKVSGKGGAAELLGLKRSTLRARMDKYNIRKPHNRDGSTE